MEVDEIVSDSLVDPPEGYQTPPMDLSFLTAAIAQASSTADPQQLAKMILSASNKVAAAKEEAKQKAAKQDAAKTRHSQTRRGDPLKSKHGERKTMEQPDTTSQFRDIASNKAYSRKQEEQKPLISRMNGRPKLSGYERTLKDNEELKERSSLDGSGGSGQQSRSSSSSRGSHGIDEQPAINRKRMSGSYEQCNSDRSLLKEDFTERASQLGDDYFAEITRDGLPVRGTDISDTIDFQDFEDDNENYKRNQSRTSVRSSQDKLKDIKDLESQKKMVVVDDSKKLQKKKLSNGNAGQFDRSSRNEEVSRQGHDSSSVRQHPDMYARMEDSSQDIRTLQQKSRDKLSSASNRTNRALKENIGPLKSQSIPVVSKHRKSKDSVEMSKSHSHLAQRTVAPGDDFNREILSRGSVYNVPKRKGNGQNLELGQMVEPRSQAIPDGEPTEVEPTMTSRTPSVTGHDLEDQVTSLSLTQQRSNSASPRQKDKKTPPKDRHDASSPLIQRNSLDGSPCRPKESLRQRRTIDGASFGKNGSQKTASRDDDVFKRPDAPAAPQSRRHESTSIHDALSNKGQQRPPEGLEDAEVMREVDVSRFSMDSQADIILGKHRIIQTPRDRRIENAMNRQRVEGFCLGERKDVVVDAEVDSGFSSEHPHRLPHFGNAPQLTVSNVAHVQEMWKGSREQLPVTLDDIEGSHNFSAINAEIISPVPSPGQSPLQSPVGPTKQNTSAGSDAERTLLAQSTNRTLVAETPELVSPRSSGSSHTHSIASSMNKSASSSSDRSCSTPKRGTKPEMDNTNKGLENPPSFAGTHHLAPPPYHQQYTSSAATASSIPNPTRRLVLPSYVEQPTFYTNQTLSETNFLQHYVNDRPVSKLSSTNIPSLHETLQPRSASHLGIPHQPGLYLGQTAPLASNPYGAPHRMDLTGGSGAPSLHPDPYAARLGGHQQQQQQQRRLRSRSVEPHSMNPLSWPAYHMQDTKTNGVAGLLETAVHSGPTVPVPPLGHPTGE